MIQTAFNQLLKQGFDTRGKGWTGGTYITRKLEEEGRKIGKIKGKLKGSGRRKGQEKKIKKEFREREGIMKERGRDIKEGRKEIKEW